MTFEEACKALSEGKYVRRAGWAGGIRGEAVCKHYGLRADRPVGSLYIRGHHHLPEFDEMYMYIRHPRGLHESHIYMRLEDDDMHATDWEEYEPPQASPAAQ